MTAPCNIRKLFHVAVFLVAQGLGAAGELVLPDGRTAAVVATIVASPDSVSISPNGSHLTTFDDGAAHIWNVSSGALLAKLPRIGGGTSSWNVALLDDPCIGAASELPQIVTAENQDFATPVVLFGCDGKLLASLPTDHLARYNLHSATAIPSCRLFVMQYAQGVVVVDAERRAIREDLGKLFPSGAELIVSAHRSCSAIVAERYINEEKPGRLLLIDLRSRAVVEVATLPGDAVRFGPSFSRRGIAVSSDDETVALVVDRWARDRRALRSSTNFVELYDLASGKLIRSIPISSFSADEPPDALTFVGNLDLLLVGADHKLYAVAARSGTPKAVDVPVSTHFALPWLLARSANGAFLAVAGVPGEVRVYRLPKR